MKLLMHDSIPCWYELSWDAKALALVIRIHKECVEAIKKRRKVMTETEIRSEIVEGLGEELDFKVKPFLSDFARDYGFNGVLKNSGLDGDFLLFSVPLPVIRVSTGKKCTECKGTGKSELASGVCLFCDGEKIGHRFDYEVAFLVSASLTILFMELDFEFETSSKLPQLMTLYTMTRMGMHGGSLHGVYGTELCRWFCSLGPRKINEAEDAMKTAYLHMLGGAGFYGDHDFRMVIENRAGWLNVSCPGNACGLHPSGSCVSEGEGYKFSCHNVDTPAEQFTLLIGLAVLHDMARAEMGK